MIWGRALSSDQNGVGLRNGEVVRARAIVRLLPEKRWDSEILLSISTTPLTENNNWLDKLEARADPHTFDSADDGRDPASSSAQRRARITYKDLQAFGFSDMCPRCACHRSGNHGRAEFHRHTEFAVQGFTSV